MNFKVGTPALLLHYTADVMFLAPEENVGLPQGDQNSPNHFDTNFLNSYIVRV